MADPAVTPGELIAELDAVTADHEEGSLHVMIDVAGRWTGIKGTWTDEEAGIVFIETQD